MATITDLRGELDKGIFTRDELASFGLINTSTRAPEATIYARVKDIPSDLNKRGELFSRLRSLAEATFADLVKRGVIAGAIETRKHKFSSIWSIYYEIQTSDGRYILDIA